MVSLLKSSLAVGYRLYGSRRIKLQGLPRSEYGTSSRIVLLTRKGTAESWSFNLGSNLTGCSCGKNGVVIAARALSFADVFATSAFNFKRDSSCFKRNPLLESLTRASPRELDESFSSRVLQLNLFEAVQLGISPHSQSSSRRSAGGISRTFFLHFQGKAGTQRCHPRL